MNAGYILGRLNPYSAQEKKIVEDQTTGDIISAINKAHKMYAPEYKKIAVFFKGSNPKQTGKKLFNFLKDNVNYVIEPNEKQTVKSPAAILAQGHGDCKHYSLFIGGVLQQLGIPFAYRFASYKLFDKQPGHVFVVINPGTQNEIWIDPVLNNFDYRKQYTYAKDKKMALYSISGIGQTKTEKQAAKKAAGKTVGQKLKKGSQVILKVAAAPVRNAFLALVTLNFGNLGVKMKAAWDKAPSKLQKFWEGSGGKIEALKKAWEKGATKKRIFGDDGIGVIQGPAALAAAAAPLIVKAGELLKSIGIDPAELVQIGKDAINEKAQQLAKKALQPKAAKDAANLESANILDQNLVDNTGVPAFQKSTVTNMLPFVLGAGIVIYFVTRKK